MFTHLLNAHFRSNEAAARTDNLFCAPCINISFFLTYLFTIQKETTVQNSPDATSFQLRNT